MCGGGPNPGLRETSDETWVWASISPGITVRPATSTAPSGVVPVASATSVMTPRSIAIVARSSTRPEPGSSARAFHSLRSFAGIVATRYRVAAEPGYPP